ncbi:predicted GTPase [Halanaerobium saccharolyticum subsp. saccharolyticum DSM 6643]|uniref:Predicted GTPase n=1 Tax=Halanaerobium saccharolyticum subsp. saccharolyticum DSM 6643 TaxID=1293054 RepID=M5EBQ6_9FIRM|nr:[FeFe] hydrogenase H-cluster maturation GTPase HydF [Halanaerobium saccharolyticum]CCU78143.1 predicted GTPase [Halanaerobium saccharolyticum subsp. saccharolyticum DSM 6643]
MQETPKGNRPHIGVFGRRNAGKSSLINSLTNQELALVSDVPGTTTDPVYKAMELQPLGPVIMIDTAGIDDSGQLGELRVKKTLEIIRKIDLAVLVIDPEHGIENYEKDLLNRFFDASTPIVPVINKVDLNFDQDNILSKIKTEFKLNPVMVSTIADSGIEELREEIVTRMPADTEESFIVGDLVNPGDTIVLVTPIDLAAPKGRLILPQVQTIRDILDHDGITMICKERELKLTLDKLKEDPKLVITDSQAFMKVDADVPEDVLLTGFSILFARYKGDLEIFLRGAKKLENLNAGDKILIAEACTHRRQADDIGTVKLPRWMRSKVGGDLEFDHVSGREYPENLTDYDLILHCGACMLNKKEVISRLKEADSLGVPVINYGMAIAQLHGILDRALKPFASAYRMWMAEKKKN